MLKGDSKGPRRRPHCDCFVRLGSSPAGSPNDVSVQQLSSIELHVDKTPYEFDVAPGDAHFITQCSAPSSCGQNLTPMAGMNVPQPDPQCGSRDESVNANSLNPPTFNPTPAKNTRDPCPEEQRPPLPPRPNTLSLLNDEAALRATLQAEATTAVSRAEIGSQSPDAIGNTHSSVASRGLSKGLKAKASLSQLASRRSSETGDSASIRSSILCGDFGDVEALFKDLLSTAAEDDPDTATLLRFPEFPADGLDDAQFLNEFEPVGELDEDASNEGAT